MKNLLILTCLLPCLTFSQISIIEEFNFQYFSQSNWFGDTASFCPNNALLLCDSVASSSSLSLPSRISENFELSFYFKMNFNPSSSNNAKLILASDQMSLDSSKYAFYLCLGCSGQDEIALWQKENMNHTLLGQSTGILNSSFNEYSLKVQRDSNSLWQVLLNDSLLFNAIDHLDFQSNYLSWSCKYTKTRSDKMEMDSLYFKGSPWKDKIAPRLDSMRVWSERELTLFWSEESDSIHKNQLHSSLEIDSLFLGSNKVSLRFKQAMRSGVSYFLSIQDLADTSGNYLDTIIYWDYYNAQNNDVIFSELMIDPSPIVRTSGNELLGREYIEVFNKRAYDIDLSFWQLIINEDSIPLEGVIKAFDYLLFSEDSVLKSAENIRQEFIDLSSSQLHNQSFTAQLLGPNLKVVDRMNFDLDNFKSANKHLGGWSLEKLDLSADCESPLNWAYSENEIGGSPGKENSQTQEFIDSIAPVLVSKNWINGYTEFKLEFSEEIFIDKTSVDTIVAQSQYISSVSVLKERINFHLTKELDSNITLEIDLHSMLKDCSGNSFENYSIKIGRPTKSAANELKINELLFDPNPGVSEFIEFGNFGNAWIDLSLLKLGYSEPGTGSLFYESYLSEEQLLLAPGELVALCEDALSLKKYYCDKKANLINQDFLNMDNTSLSLSLMHSDMTIIDSVTYHKNLHSGLIQDVRGVSLERIPQGYNQSKKWQSSSLICNGASPGFENSFSFYSSSELLLDYDVFSPNNDLYRDELIFRMKLEDEVQLRLKIYSINGEIVRDLVDSEFQRGGLNYFWDGTKNDGAKCPSGIYIAIAEIVDVNANRKLIRKSVILED